MVFGMGLVLLVATGCRSAKRDELNLDEVAHRYVRLSVALGEHDPDSIDYYSGAEERVADIQRNAPSAAQINKDATGLLLVLEAVKETSERKDYLVQQLRAVACRAAYLAGTKTRFDEEVECSFQMKLAREMPEKKIEQVQKKLSKLLPGKGELAQRHDAFEAGYAVPRAKLPKVMGAAIAACRDQTAKHLSIPKDERFELEYTSDKPWAGFSRYRGGHKSDIAINTDFPLTVDRVLDLACHETYPGHHMFNMLVDDTLVKRDRREEFTAQPTYSPQSFISEGVATLASEIAFTSQERLRIEKEILFPMAGLKPEGAERYLAVKSLMGELEPAIPIIARRYLDGELEFVRAGEQLERQALMGHYFETLKYMNEFRSYVVTYTYAPAMLRTFDANADDEQRWKTYETWAQLRPVPKTWMN
jgi:hypothetical protein